MEIFHFSEKNRNLTIFLGKGEKYMIFNMRSFELVAGVGIVGHR